MGDKKNVTGIAERWDPEATLDLVRILQPDVNKIYVIHDYTVSGLGTREDLLSIMDKYKTYFSFEFSAELPASKILEQIASLPPEFAVLLFGYNIDSEGRVFDSAETGAYFGSVSSVPVYTMDQTRFNGGVLGGSLFRALKCESGDHERDAGREQGEHLPQVVEEDAQPRGTRDDVGEIDREDQARH